MDGCFNNPHFLKQRTFLPARNDQSATGYDIVIVHSAESTIFL
jgi:hypothetical protein